VRFCASLSSGSLKLRGSSQPKPWPAPCRQALGLRLCHAHRLHVGH
jgi:hypothetical protein